MNKISKSLSVSALIAMAFTGPASAADLTAKMDNRHKACLEMIAQDADAAYEEAMIWRGEGGGRRARHCEAMALFALGHKEEAAYRLDLLAGSVMAGNSEMRTDFYAEAANFWLMAGQVQEAYNSASAGLEINAGDPDLRIARARAYALLGRYNHAEIDLTSALAFEPDNAEALRYRADARRRQDKLDEAKSDIDKAMQLAPDSVPTAVVRGEIIEALRLSKQKGTKS